MIGTAISHYKILEKLGEGGMGVVYKADDITLDRQVALKFLPPRVSASNDDKARFIQEAKAAAALSHPNICTIYGVEEHDGQTFIVMEYVDGKSLRDLRTNVLLKQALDIGIQLADGLTAAHEKGIVHRDIKPENIMLRKDGRIQIMDFGLAKLKGASRLTKEGSTVGTAGYMSPEQVQGHDTDHRTDIFSLGVVLYELITGKSPFKGIHETAVAYEIVNTDVDPMVSLKPEVDPALDAVVLDCLEKDPRERCQSVAEVARDLRRLKRDTTRTRRSSMSGVAAALKPQQPEPARGSRIQKRELILAVSAGVFFITALILAVLHFQEPPRDVNVLRTTILAHEKMSYLSFGGGHIALSPDGRMVACVLRDSSGKSFLWVRPLNSISARLLSGTEGAEYPFWSPDGRFIGFFAGSSMKKIEASGGPPQTICDAAAGRGGSWNKDGIIVFAPNVNAPVAIVFASGGVPRFLHNLDSSRHETGHRWPSFLKDGKHFLYVSRASAVIGSGDDAVCVGSLDSTEKSKTLTKSSSNAMYTDGYLLFVREQSLMAQKFDPDRLELIGDAAPIAENVQYDGAFSRASFSASENGVLVYQSGAAQGSELIWHDRTGKRLGTVGKPGLYYDLRLSPDGKRVAVSYFETQFRNLDIWIHDLQRNIPPLRFTFDPEADRFPVWSSDGSRLIFDSRRKQRLDIYQKASTSVGSEEVLLESNSDKILNDWSPDGKYLSYMTSDYRTQYDIWMLPLTGDRKPILFLRIDFNEGRAMFSPDGKWIAYSSNESGQYQIYVSSFPVTGGKFQISTTTGTRPHWRRDGKELYYITNDDKMMAAEVRTKGATFEVGEVRQLFNVSILRFGFASDSYDVTADGQRFLVNTLVGEGSTREMTLVVNWPAELRK